MTQDELVQLNWNFHFKIRIDHEKIESLSLVLFRELMEENSGHKRLKLHEFWVWKIWIFKALEPFIARNLK